MPGKPEYRINRSSVYPVFNSTTEIFNWIIRFYQNLLPDLTLGDKDTCPAALRKFTALLPVVLTLFFLNPSPSITYILTENVDHINQKMKTG